MSIEARNGLYFLKLHLCVLIVLFGALVLEFPFEKGSLQVITYTLIVGVNFSFLI